MAGRIFEQVFQTAETSYFTNNAVFDVAGLELTLPSDGTYRVEYGITVKASTVLASVPILEVEALLYNATDASYFPTGKEQMLVQFGSTSEEDLISAERSITRTLYEAALITVSASSTLKVQTMYTVPTSDDVTVTIIHNGSSGINGVKGYLSYEKMTS